MKTSQWLIAAVSTLVFTAQGPGPARAATVLFDFEDAAEMQALHDEGRATLGPGKTLERDARFATSGRFALRFSTPRWKPGLPQWPSFECRLPLTNWAAFDRLILDVTNPGEHSQTLSLFISDSRTPTRQGLAHTARLAPLSYTPMVVPLEQFAEKKVNPADIRVLHFFTSEPPGDMAVCIDRLTLLKKGEAVPAVPASFLKEFAAIQGRRVESLRAAIEATRTRVQPVISKAPVLTAWSERTQAELLERVNALQQTVGSADATALEAGARVADLQGELARWESLAALRGTFEVVRSQVQARNTPRSDLVVGFATSMEKVLPRTASAPFTVTNRIGLSLAQNEKESFQVLVLPCERDLKGVQVRVSDLHTSSGGILSARNVQAVPVGYVQTRTTPPYGTSHIGWWPDPILDFLSTADISRGDLQSFWVRVRAPKGQGAGLYRGTLEVLVEGAPVFSFELAVRVFGFAVPDRSPLPLAITFGPHDFPTEATQKEQAEWRKAEDYPINAWKKHKLRWADFLADYYISFDSLYHHEVPDFALLSHLKRQGRLDMFNLGYYGHIGASPNDAETWKTKNLPRLRAGYAKAREHGLLQHAYIYGCDEVTKDFFPQVQKTVEILKAEFPDVMVMTTTYDQSYGMDSVIKSMNAFCPLTPSFDSAKAATARAAGRQVWWYICCGPHHPHANMFIEYPAIEGRLLMGAMTTKYRPDGFLYYQISIWNSRKPIENGPFTTWDPRSWTTYHGDGSWTCVGPGGTPLPTIRLENFRDGLEDFAYVRALESAIAKVEASPGLRAQKTGSLQRARGLLEVPADVLKSKTEYTRDPSVLYRYRNALAEAVEALGTTSE